VAFVQLPRTKKRRQDSAKGLCQMAKIVIYQKPTCSTCRETVKLVQASGQPFTAINYYEQPFTKALLKELLKKAGLPAKEILRTKEDIYKELGLAKKQVSEDELINLMLKHPDLIQRPLVEKGERAILARPAETVKKLL
jgi:arsenate reductase